MFHKTTALTLISTVLTLAPLAAGTLDARTPREARRADAFVALHGTGDGPQQPAARMPLGQALRAYALVSQGFDYSGRGDASYWMRSARNCGISARALGAAIRNLGQSMHTGPISGAISGLGSQLLAIDWSGTGDASFWMGRTRAICQKAIDVGQLLEQMSQANPGNGSPDGTVRTAYVLEGLARIAASPDQSGNGDAYFWMKTTRDFVRIGRATGRALASLVGDGNDPLTVVLRSMATQLQALDDMGTGDAHYWMARAGAVAEQMEGFARSLADIAANL